MHCDHYDHGHSHVPATHTADMTFSGGSTTVRRLCDAHAMALQRYWDRGVSARGMITDVVIKSL
jgi:hypothetical protein